LSVRNRREGSRATIKRGKSSAVVNSITKTGCYSMATGWTAKRMAKDLCSMPTDGSATAVCIRMTSRTVRDNASTISAHPSKDPSTTRI
jgi:hypothetical protein